MTLVEYNNGVGGAPRNVRYKLNTLVHHGQGHFTAHGFLPNAAYPFLHDAMERPLVRPAAVNADGILTYNRKVSRAWYTREDPADAV